MSKAVLVMDMPSNCEECILRNEGYCFPTSKINFLCGVYYVMKEGRKPDWCPLRELPSKYAEKDFTPIKDKRYYNGYEDGYNACIDELLKEE